MRRYNRTPVIAGETKYGTSYVIPGIRENIANGNIRVERMVLQEKQRLDTLAGRFYGDGRLWWLIAIGSAIGFALQVPPGTLITIPNLEDVAGYVGG